MNCCATVTTFSDVLGRKFWHERKLHAVALGKGRDIVNVFSLLLH